VAGHPPGVAIAGTIVGSASSRGGMAFTSAEHGVWWLVLGLGVGIVVVGLLSTGRWALGSARRAAALFDGGGEGAAGAWWCYGVVWSGANCARETSVAAAS
jgi:hypothetical protein